MELVCNETPRWSRRPPPRPLELSSLTDSTTACPLPNHGGTGPVFAEEDVLEKSRQTGERIESGPQTPLTPTSTPKWSTYTGSPESASRLEASTISEPTTPATPATTISTGIPSPKPIACVSNDWKWARAGCVQCRVLDLPCDSISPCCSRCLRREKAQTSPTIPSPTTSSFPTNGGMSPGKTLTGDILAEKCILLRQKTIAELQASFAAQDLQSQDNGRTEGYLEADWEKEQMDADHLVDALTRLVMESKDEEIKRLPRDVERQIRVAAWDCILARRNNWGRIRRLCNQRSQVRYTRDAERWDVLTAIDHGLEQGGMWEMVRDLSREVAIRKLQALPMQYAVMPP